MSSPTLNEDDQPEPMYRVTLLWADDVTPPVVAGEVAERTTHVDRVSADQAVEIAAGRTDIGLITIAVRLGEGYAPGWHALHTWVRQGAGWKHR